VLRAQGKCWINLQAPKRPADSRLEQPPRDRAWGNADRTPAPPIRPPPARPPTPRAPAPAGPSAGPPPVERGPRPGTHPLARWLVARGRCPNCTRSPMCAQPCQRQRADLPPDEYRQYAEAREADRANQRRQDRPNGRGGRGRGRA
jgi:hypothetical protein